MSSSGAAAGGSRPAPRAEEHLVEVADERAAVFVQEHGDEQAADQLAASASRSFSASSARSCRGLAEQGGAAHRRRPGAVAVPERGVERVAQLLAAERLGLEERQLPAVERLAELRVVVGDAEPRRAASLATEARNGSSRVGSPGGAVAAIGSTGRIPYGRQSSRSKRTGPAATGAAVASRIAVTASASSPGASGASSSRLASERSSSSTQIRSGSRPKSRGSSPCASGHIAASSPVAATRTRIPSPSSICVPTERPISGATAP